MSEAERPAENGDGPPVRADSQLERLVGQTLIDPMGRMRPHIDIDLGGVDEPSREAMLYGLLAVHPEQVLLLGVSWIDTADLKASRSEWGEPAHHIDLHRAPESPLAWDIWRLPARSVLEENAVGASLVLPESHPSWILYIEPTDDDAMLFTCAEPCAAHP